VVPVTCFLTVPAYIFVYRLKFANFALDIGIFLGLIFRITFVKNCVDKSFGLNRALNWLRPSATIKFFVAMTRLTQRFQRGGVSMQ